MQTNPTTNEPIKRGEFLRSFGLSSATLMAFYCMGTTLTSCSGSNDDPAPTPTPTTGTGLTGNADPAKGAINFTLDLASADYTKLKTNGQYVVVGNVIVAKTNSGSFVALSKACTHQGVTVQYRLAENDFWCSAHGSEFSTTGAVKKAPANGPLTLYKTSPSANGNTLTVTA